MSDAFPKLPLSRACGGQRPQRAQRKPSLLSDGPVNCRRRDTALGFARPLEARFFPCQDTPRCGAAPRTLPALGGEANPSAGDALCAVAQATRLTVERPRHAAGPRGVGEAGHERAGGEDAIPVALDEPGRLFAAHCRFHAGGRATLDPGVGRDNAGTREGWKRVDAGPDRHSGRRRCAPRRIYRAAALAGFGWRGAISLPHSTGPCISSRA